MNKGEELIARRKAVVPNAVGVFNPATAVSAKGATIIDTEGKALIDFTGGIGVLNAGHCPEPVVKAIQEQAEQLIHACFHVATYEPYVALCEKMAELFPHGEKTKVMLTNTGAEAVENAIKIARQATGRQGIICFTEAFHGRSLMALTLTSKTAYKYNCGPFAPEVYRQPFPNHYKYGNGMDMDAFIEQELNRLRQSFGTTVAADQVAAIIIEPVQGEGGFNVVPKKYLQGLRQICDEHGILLIIDEVQTGFGRTGKWAAYQHYDVTPDLSTWAKSMGSGMPIGCVMGRAELMDAARPATIGGTYLGNPVCCAAALATIQYIEEVDINKKGEEVGKIVRDRFESMQKRSNAIGNVRGLGAMVAFEMVKNGDPAQPDADLTGKLIKACYQRGVLLISAGLNKNCIRVLSPLVIDRDLLERGLDIIEEEFVKLTSVAEMA